VYVQGVGMPLGEYTGPLSHLSQERTRENHLSVGPLFDLVIVA